MSEIQGVSNSDIGIGIDLPVDTGPVPIEDRFGDERLKRANRNAQGGDGDGATAAQRQTRQQVSPNDSFSHGFSRNLYGETAGRGGIMNFVEHAQQSPHADESERRERSEAGAPAMGKSLSSKRLSLLTSQGRRQATGIEEAKGNQVERFIELCVESRKGTSDGGQDAFAKNRSQVPAYSALSVIGNAPRTGVGDAAAKTLEMATEAALASQESDGRKFFEGSEKLRREAARAGSRAVEGGSDRLHAPKAASVTNEQKPTGHADQSALTQRELANEASAASAEWPSEISEKDQLLTYRFKGAGGELLSLKLLQGVGGLGRTVVDITTQTVATALILNDHADRLARRKTRLKVKAHVNPDALSIQGDLPRKRRRHLEE